MPFFSQQSVSRIVILTGAGVSAESGLSTFRDAGGLWGKHDPMDIATPEACAAVMPALEDYDDSSDCPRCNTRGKLRPDIVWFGEIPYHMNEITSYFHQQRQGPATVEVHALVEELLAG